MYDDDRHIESVYNYNNKRVIVQGHSIFGYSILMDVDTLQEFKVSVQELDKLKKNKIGEIDGESYINPNNIT